MTKRTLIISSNNDHKIIEIKNILDHLFNIYPKSILSDTPEVEETGNTFLENAKLKAIQLSNYTSDWVLADDSGIVVDALDGQPGIYSSRFAGTNATDSDNNEKLLKLLKDVPLAKRTAHYYCAIIIAHEKKVIAQGIGKCYGIILDKYLGNNGFGYDPLFWDEQLNKTFAELHPDKKDKISHRRFALEDLIKNLNQVNP